MRGRLGAYLTYQAADFLVLRAALPVALVIVFGLLMLQVAPSSVDWSSEAGARQRMQLFRSLTEMFVLISPFLGISRLVSDDRSNGYFRFLFSKPVSIERFYLQQWVLHGVGYAAIAGVLALWLQAVTGPVPIRAAMVVVALAWILVGGVGFALSAATNYDAVLLIGAYIGSTVLHAIKAAPGVEMAEWLRQITRLTMPVQKLAYVRDQLYAGQEIPWPATLHVVAYGATGVAAAVLILRRSSFAR